MKIEFRSFLKRVAVCVGISWLGLALALPAAWAWRLEEYPLAAGNGPNGITLGPDGNIWFIQINDSGDSVARISPDGQEIVAYPTLTPLSGPERLITGPDGNIWFTEWDVSQVGVIAPDGSDQMEFATPTQPSNPAGIIVASDGNLWFAEDRANSLAMITLDGVITEYPLPTPNAHPFYICNGPDGNIWFVEFAADQIGRFDPVTKAFDEFPILTPNAGPNDIVTGSDGNLWFTEGDNNLIGRIAPDGSGMVEFPIPTADSVPFGIVAGADGNLWFTEFIGNNIGVMNTSGDVLMEIPLATADAWPLSLALDGVGNVWFTELQGEKIGEIIFALFQITAADFTVPVGTTTFTYQVVRDQDSTHEDTVEVYTMDGSAVAGVDYVAQQSMLTFSPGETMKELSIQVLDNPNAAGDRSFTLNLRNPSFGVLLGDSQTVTLASPGGGGCGLTGASTLSGSTYLLGLAIGFAWLLLRKKITPQST